MLNTLLACARPSAAVTMMCQLTNKITVEEIWNLATQNMQRPERLLVAINQEYADFNNEVYDGDEIAFFPSSNGWLT